MQKMAGMSLCRILLEASFKGESVGSGLDIGFHTKTFGNMPICPVATSLREGDIARHLLTITINHKLVLGNGCRLRALEANVHAYFHKHRSSKTRNQDLSLSLSRALLQRALQQESTCRSQTYTFIRNGVVVTKKESLRV